MKKRKTYILNIKNYILVTLAIIAIILLLCECEDLKMLVITKIISLAYITLFAKANNIIS